MFRKCLSNVGRREDKTRNAIDKKIRLNGKRFLEVWDQRNRKRGGAGKNA